MTINVGIITQSTDSFGQWLTKTNLVINALAQYVVSTNSNTAPGNAAITGTFYANSYFVSNAGSLFLSTNSTANAIANSNQLIFNSGPTSNAIITSSGMLIDGSTAYTKTLISMGNTVIRTGNVSTNSAYFTDQLFVGNNFLYKNSVAFNQANIVSANFAANLVVGAADGNTIITRTGVYISYNDNLPAGDTNSYFNAYELKVGTVKTSNLSISGSNSLFTANVLFAGSNNYFINGIGSAGDVDIVGAGRHFSHGYYSNTIASNITFMYNGAGGGSNFARNIFQNTIGHSVFTNTVAEVINLNLGTLTATVFPNATPGTRTSTGNTIILSANTTKAYFANALGVGGITTPLDALHVEGAIRLESAAGSGYVRLLAPPTNVNFDLILPDKKGKIKQVLVVVDEDNGILGFDDNHGSNPDDVDVEARSLGVGVNAPGQNNKGEIRAKGNVIAYYSDERLKDVIGPIENALEKVQSLDGFYYKGNDTAKELGYDDEKIQVGLSAQKVQAVLPEAVFPAPVDEKYLTVQYDKLVPLLIEAIKELKAEIDSLKNGNKD
jgi:hypothetical protein